MFCSLASWMGDFTCLLDGPGNRGSLSVSVSPLVTFADERGVPSLGGHGTAFPPLGCATGAGSAPGPLHHKPVSFQVRECGPWFLVSLSSSSSSSGLIVTHLGRGGRMEGRARGVGVPELGVPAPPPLAEWPSPVHRGPRGLSRACLWMILVVNVLPKPWACSSWQGRDRGPAPCSAARGWERPRHAALCSGGSRVRPWELPSPCRAQLQRGYRGT